ncbi:MAG: hypothetical protein QM742_09795 [Aquabacterium sp.]
MGGGFNSLYGLHYPGNGLRIEGFMRSLQEASARASTLCSTAMAASTPAEEVFARAARHTDGSDVVGGSSTDDQLEGAAGNDTLTVVTATTASKAATMQTGFTAAAATTACRAMPAMTPCGAIWGMTRWSASGADDLWAEPAPIPMCSHVARGRIMSTRFRRPCLRMTSS